MAVANDLNHDGYADLLVGAPLEDDHQGALYIYHGDEYYIIPQYKQVKYTIILFHVYSQIRSLRPGNLEILFFSPK